MANFNSSKDNFRQRYIQLLDNDLNDSKLSKNIEKQLYNSSIRLAKSRYIKRSWSNIIFKQLYISKVRSFYSNISETSYIQNPNFKKKRL